MFTSPVNLDQKILQSNQVLFTRVLFQQQFLGKELRKIGSDTAEARVTGAITSASILITLK